MLISLYLMIEITKFYAIIKRFEMKTFQEPFWQHVDQRKDLSESLKHWLLYPGSFMERLKQNGIQDAYLKVLQQDWQIPLISEQEILGIKDKALIREVLILNEQTIFMYARTVFPKQTLTGELQHLAHLENRSLGSILFKDPSMVRSEFEIACLKPGMLWYETVIKHLKEKPLELWARRSTFNLQGKELLLTEVFLPEIEKYAV